MKYDSLPNTHTLDTLVQFLGYENWRGFRSQNGNGTENAITVRQINGNGHGYTSLSIDYCLQITYAYVCSL